MNLVFSLVKLVYPRPPGILGGRLSLLRRHLLLSVLNELHSVK